MPSRLTAVATFKRSNTPKVLSLSDSSLSRIRCCKGGGGRCSTFEIACRYLTKSVIETSSKRSIKTELMAEKRSAWKWWTLAKAWMTLTSSSVLAVGSVTASRPDLRR